MPVSSTAGLEIIHQNSSIRPEDLAHSLSEGDKPGANGQRWNSKYVVVMAGKWLEILTIGHLQSTVHRVKGNPDGRLSAPCFLRPDPKVSDALEQLHLEDAYDIVSNQRNLGYFFDEY